MQELPLAVLVLDRWLAHCGICALRGLSDAYAQDLPATYRDAGVSIGVISSPPALTFNRKPNGGLEVNLINSATVDFVIDATTSFDGWLPIYTNSGVLRPFVDPDAARYPLRFYRARFK